MGFVRFLIRHLAGRGRMARVVRRVEICCPHDPEATAKIDVLMGPTGRPSTVLRCSRRREAPPGCDQLCRTCAEAVLARPLSLLLLPAGEGPPEEID